MPTLEWLHMYGPKVGSRLSLTSARMISLLHFFALESVFDITIRVHKCRDYSKVLDWAHENFVHGRSVADLERAPGALERETRP
jgi:hypothetical protein